MADDVFKPTRRKITPDDFNNNMEQPLEGIRSIQEAVAQETGQPMNVPFNTPKPDQAPFSISGNVPAAFQNILQNKARPKPQSIDEENFTAFEAPPDRPRKMTNNPVPDSRAYSQPNTDAFTNLLDRLNQKHSWEAFSLASRGKFYNNIPDKIHIRAMTGEEEQILATARYIKKGTAIDMIFQKCIQEKINTEELLAADRLHLLVFLRGISYTPEYDVEIRCPNCSMKFAHVINLDMLDVDFCPDDFNADRLFGTLPVSGFRYSYRLPNGQDEQEINRYREKRIEQWGDQNEDDTLLYRTALLLEEIEGVVMKKELSHLLKKLPIQDVAHLRNEINTPPFGVQTEIPILCPACSEGFKIDLPLETNFFFPRKKEARELV